MVCMLCPTYRNRGGYFKIKQNLKTRVHSMCWCMYSPMIILGIIISFIFFIFDIVKSYLCNWYRISVGSFARMYVCVYTCMYVCMYVCGRVTIRLFFEMDGLILIELNWIELNWIEKVHWPKDILSIDSTNTKAY